jgi:hypothetical protein
MDDAGAAPRHTVQNRRCGSIDRGCAPQIDLEHQRIRDERRCARVFQAAHIGRRDVAGYRHVSGMTVSRLADASHAATAAKVAPIR